MNMHEKIKAGTYENKKPFPEYEEERKAKETKDQETLTRFKQMRTEYRQEINKLRQNFESDLKEMAEEICEIKFSKETWNKMFEIAWESGHSSGYYEVYLEMDSIIDIVKLIVKDVRKE